MPAAAPVRDPEQDSTDDFEHQREDVPPLPSIF